jgi:hypothetical protein
MSFQRQWFPPKYSVGLSIEALRFQEFLNIKNFELAHEVVSQNYLKDQYYWSRQSSRLNRHKNRYYCHDSKRYASSIKILFSGFWPDMNPGQCQLLDFIRTSAPELRFEVITEASDADIVILSCYEDLSSVLRSSTSADRWIFLGENVRPEYYNFDYSISFDLSSYSGRNIYLPLWLLEIDWFKRSYPDRLTRALHNFVDYVEHNYANRLDAVVFVGNNAEPFREHLIQQLKSHGIRVDRFGSHTRPIENKLELLKKYKATIAFENSFYPGYITEKIVDAHISGCSILYHGGFSSEVITSLRLDPYCVHQCSLSDEGIKDILEFLRKSFACNSRRTVSPLSTRESLMSEFGRICSGIRHALSAYLHHVPRDI